MKIKRKPLLFFSGCLLLVGVVGVAYGQEKYSRERYQLIVDRAPFGTAVESVVIPGGTASPQVVQDLERQVRLNFLLESEEDGTIKAGFQILRPTAGQAKSFVLEEGENFEQIQVKLISIDLEQSIANVEYNGLSVPLMLSKAAASSANNRNNRTRTTTATTRNTTATPTTPTTNRRFNGGFQATTTSTTTPPMPTTMTMPTMDGNDGGMPAMIMDFGDGGPPAMMNTEDLRSRMMQQQGGAGGRRGR